jgi:hypothetical protein
VGLIRNLESPDRSILDLKDGNLGIFVPEEAYCFGMTGKIKNLMGLRQFDNGSNRLFAPAGVKINKDFVHHDGERFGPLGKFPDEAETERKIELFNRTPTQLGGIPSRPMFMNHIHPVIPQGGKNHGIGPFCNVTKIPARLADDRWLSFFFIS